MDKHDQYTDQQLVRQYLEGKEASFEVLLNRHKDRIFGYIMKMIKDVDLANDVFQDTFIKVVQTLQRGKYNEEGKFLPWVMRIAHNLMIDHFRREKKMPKISETRSSKEEFNIFNVLPNEDKNIEEDIIKNQIESDVVKLLDFLPEEQRTVLNKRIFVGMSFKDIAEQESISINTALGRMRYALINMRKMIEENNMILTLD